MGDDPKVSETEMMLRLLSMGKIHDGVFSRRAVMPSRTETTVAPSGAGVLRASETARTSDGQVASIQDAVEEFGGLIAAQTLAAAGGNDSDDGNGRGFRDDRNKKEDDISDDGSEEGSTTTRPSGFIDLSSSSQSSSEDAAVPDRNAPDGPEAQPWVVDHHRVYGPVLTPLPEGVTVEMRIAERLNILDTETTALAQLTGRMGNGFVPMYDAVIDEDDDELLL
ncbi:hypothetical protein QBC47DRAFT_358555 [Echria macrotheca]|uniref:Uncharacterized protein n=1 Tax=Echria macrotheca TaxID=438768 RepID=A0AAJ0BI58_9PEZI|nr:hypothetical protein QBC47DRAFT_358555 [Echria macrotheca]